MELGGLPALTSSAQRNPPDVNFCEDLLTFGRRSRRFQERKRTGPSARYFDELNCHASEKSASRDLAAFPCFVYEPGDFISES